MATIRHEKQGDEWVAFITSESGTVHEYRTPVFVKGIDPWPDREMTEEIIQELWQTPESCRMFFRSQQMEEMLTPKVEDGTLNQGEINVTRL